MYSPTFFLPPPLTFSCLFLTQKYWLGNATKWGKRKKRWGREIAIQMRCVYFCLAFEERRGVVSLNRRKGPLRYSPTTPALFSFSPTTALNDTPTHTHTHPLHVHANFLLAHAAFPSFLVVRWWWGEAAIWRGGRGMVGCAD